MKLKTSNRPDVETLAAVIARSPINMTESALAILPGGFEKVDVAILHWIAAESRHASRRYQRS